MKLVYAWYSPTAADRAGKETKAICGINILFRAR